MSVDNIIVMDEGKIVEKGTHDNLLKKIDGYYYKLYHASVKERKKYN